MTLDQKVIGQLRTILNSSCEERIKDATALTYLNRLNVNGHPHLRAAYVRAYFDMKRVGGDVRKYDKRLANNYVRKKTKEE